MSTRRIPNKLAVHAVRLWFSGTKRLTAVVLKVARVRQKEKYDNDRISAENKQAYATYFIKHTSAREPVRAILLTLCLFVMSSLFLVYTSMPTFFFLIVYFITPVIFRGAVALFNVLHESVFVLDQSIETPPTSTSLEMRSLCRPVETVISNISTTDFYLTPCKLTSTGSKETLMQYIHIVDYTVMYEGTDNSELTVILCKNA